MKQLVLGPLILAMLVLSLSLYLDRHHSTVVSEEAVLRWFQGEAPGCDRNRIRQLFKRHGLEIQNDANDGIHGFLRNADSSLLMKKNIRVDVEFDPRGIYQAVQIQPVWVGP
jgi:hypothetical protein